MPGPHDPLPSGRGPVPAVRGDSSPAPSRDGHATDLGGLFRKLAAPKPHVAFLLDLSGSMEGQRHEEMVEGCERAIRSLQSKGSEITIVGFANEARTLVARSARSFDLRRLLRESEIGGGTEMHLAFAAARSPLHGSPLPVVHLITDGMPSDRARTIEEARLCRERGIVVRCTGTSGADLEFLRQLAGGEATKRADVVPPSGFRSAIERAATAPLPAPETRPLGP